MDALAGLISGPRARGAFLLHVRFDPPWSLRIEDEAPLTLVAQLQQDAWLVRDGEPPIRLAPGDVALIRGPDPYVLADEPATPPRVVVHPDQRCQTLDGEDLQESMRLGVRTWGNAAKGSMQMLVGTYGLESEVSRRLLDALPAYVHLPCGEWDSPVVGLLAEEITRDLPGQEVILDRLLDLLLMSSVRAWCARPDSDAPGWLAAGDDPGVAAALRLLYDEPARAWTVAGLASEVGMSRAALARRFTDVVGAPPMAFLTEWRLTLAADLVCEPGTTLGAVAEQVGYSSAYALSAAFKRVRGISPKTHRRAQARA